jgi:hypothetical protein
MVIGWHILRVRREQDELIGKLIKGDFEKSNHLIVFILQNSTLSL